MHLFIFIVKSARVPTDLMERIPKQITRPSPVKDNRNLTIDLNGEGISS